VHAYVIYRDNVNCNIILS